MATISFKEFKKEKYEKYAEFSGKILIIGYGSIGERHAKVLSKLDFIKLDVQGAELTRIYQGWKVISWVVILALPITLPASIWLWLSHESKQVITQHANFGMLVLGLSSMYLGFIPWYRGLKDAGTARGAQVQQLQVFLTLGWSVILLGEEIPPSTLLASIGIVLSVTWAILSRQRNPNAN